MADPVLRITTAGAAALASDDNVVGVNGPVTVTAIVLGDGQGPGGAADDARTALRSRRERPAVDGRHDSASGTVAVQVRATGPLAYDVTEMGVLATIGAGQEFLLAYWSNAGAVWFSRVANDPHLIGSLLRVGATAADIAVTISPQVAFGTVDTFLELSDTPATYANAAGKYARVNAAGTDIEFVEAPMGGRAFATDYPTANITIPANSTATVMSLSLRMPRAGVLRLAWRATRSHGTIPASLRLRVDDGAWKTVATGTIAPPGGGGSGGPWKYGLIEPIGNVSEGLIIPVDAGLVEVEMRGTANAADLIVDGTPSMSAGRWTFPSWLVAELLVNPPST